MVEINKLIKAPIDEKWIKKIVQKNLDKMKVKDDKEISIALVGDKAIRKLNKIYRGIDKVTDVLSFSDVNEIIICYPQARRQAKKQKHSEKKEIEILLVHGLLHLLGYDHQKNNDFLEMKRLEKKLLKS